MPSKDTPRPELLDQLLRRAQSERTLTSKVIRLRNPLTQADPGALFDLLGVPPEDIAPSVAEALAAIEHIEHMPSSNPTAWLRFKWRVFAFSSLVDAFDSPVFDDGTPSTMFQLWYFYFETKYLLLECIGCTLSGLEGAASALHRPLLEFSAAQTYFYRRTHRERSYAALTSYLRSGNLPSWHTLTKHCVPNSRLGKTVRWRLQAHHNALSRSGSHAYHPQYSPKDAGALRPRLTLDGLFGWHTTSSLLDGILWLYYLSFPALFHPRDVMRLFGCNGPVGLIVDSHTAAVVQRSLPQAEFDAFHAEAAPYSETVDEVVAGHQAMSDEEILETWNEMNGTRPTDPEAAYLATMATLRASRELMAWKAPKEPSPEVSERLEHLPIDTLAWWQEARHK